MVSDGTQDVAPQLIEDITEEFHRLYDSSGTIQGLLQKIRQGTATYAEAQEYSLEVSRLIGRAYEKHISSATLPDGRMYYNIASRLIPSTLDENYKLVSDYAARAQQILNQKAGIGLKAQTAPKNEDRVNGIVNAVSNAEWYDDVAGWLLTAMENFSQNIVDQTVKANADFHARAGLSPKIIRKAERTCCKWCRALAGEFDYSDLPDDIYRRHENCRCTVLYDPADGSKKLQNVHTKKWTDPQESAMIEKRQLIGLRTNNVTVSDISQHAFERIKERNVTMDAVRNAIEHPLKTEEVKYDADGRPSFKIVGRRATISINPQTGVITTVYPTHTKTANKLMGRK